MSPEDPNTQTGGFGRDAAPRRFGDHKSKTGLSIFALVLAGFAIVLLAATLMRNIGSDEWLMLFVANTLLFLAWRCWRFARAPYLTLNRDHLVIGGFFRPLRLSYADIAGAAVELTMMRPKQNHPPVAVHTLHLALSNGGFAKRILPFGSDEKMLQAFARTTGIQPDHFQGAEAVLAWKRRLLSN